MAIHLLMAVALLQAPHHPSARSPSADTPVSCTNCAEWNRPQPPFKLHGRSYYVGPQGLSAILIQTSEGLILLDGGLPQSVQL